MQAEVDKRLAHYGPKLAEADRTIKARKGVLTRQTYKLIRACLHPDRSASEARYSGGVQSLYGLGTPHRARAGKAAGAGGAQKVARLLAAAGQLKRRRPGAEAATPSIFRETTPCTVDPATACR